MDAGRWNSGQPHSKSNSPRIPPRECRCRGIKRRGI